MIDTESWPARAERLRAELVEAGKLTDDRLQAAVLSVPRHVFVPSFYEQNGSPEWERRSREDTPEEWWSAVYANRPLTTQVGQLDPDDDNNLLPTSSSSAPSLMLRMLEALRLDDGHRVLEIGTGTGYNVALLSHRLGADHVYSVDVDPTLVEAARDHLAGLGFTPTLHATDGARGMPEHAPFDRIIGTCAVDRVPWDWAEQTAPGGLVLVDLKVRAAAGNLVLLERFPDRLEGRFDLGGYATFMHMRNAEAARVVAPSMDRDTDEARHATTDADVPHEVWGNYVTWFLLHLAPGAQRVTFRSVMDKETGKAGAALYMAADGSWCEVEPGEPGTSRAVSSGGPRDLWADIVAAHELWASAGRPDWDRFGLTVAPEEQWVWLDRPDGAHRWRL